MSRTVTITTKGGTVHGATGTRSVIVARPGAQGPPGADGIDGEANFVDPVDAAITTDIADLNAFTVAQPGITLIEGQSVLPTAQSTASQNRPHVVGAVVGGVAPLTARGDVYGSGASCKVNSGKYSGTFALKTPGTIVQGTTSQTWEWVGDAFGNSENIVYSAYFGVSGGSGRNLADACPDVNTGLAKILAGGELRVISGDNSASKPLIRATVGNDTAGMYLMTDQGLGVPAGWHSITGPVTITGCGRQRQLALLAGGGADQIIAGDGADFRKPAMWLSTAPNVELRNIILSAGVALRVGVSDTLGCGKGNDQGTKRDPVHAAALTAVTTTACPAVVSGVTLSVGKFVALANQGGVTETQRATANQRYLPAVGQGGGVGVVRAATTALVANLANHSDSQGGVTLILNDFWLHNVTAESGHATVGIYQVTADLGGGQLASTRIAELNTTEEWNAGSILCRVSEGTHAGKVFVWAQNTIVSPITLGTTALEFYQTWAHPANGLYEVTVDNGDGTFTLARRTDLDSTAELLAGALFEVKWGDKMGVWHLRPVPSDVSIGTTPIELMRQHRYADQEVPGALVSTTVGSLLVENCWFGSGPSLGSGPAVDIGYVLQMCFRRCKASKSKTTPDEPHDSFKRYGIFANRSNLLIDDISLSRGGILHYIDGKQLWRTRITRVLYECTLSGGVAGPPAVRIKAPTSDGYGVIDDIIVADGSPAEGYDVIIEDCDPGLRNIRVSRCGRVKGPCAPEGLNQATRFAEAASPFYKRQTETIGSRIYAVQDTARFICGAQRVREVTELSHDLTTWTSGGTTITGGQADPHGGARAYKIESPDGLARAASARTSIGTINVAVGDIVAFGCWFRGVTLPTNGPIRLTFQTPVATSVWDNYPSTGTFLVKPPHIPNGNWMWAWGFCEAIVAVNSNRLQLNLDVNKLAAEYFYFHPMIRRFPVGSVSKDWAAEFAAHMGDWDPAAPKGSIAFDRGADLYFADSHLIGDGTVPGIAAGAGAGASPTIALSATSNDRSGTVTLTTGTGAGAGLLATITFSRAYPSAPRVILTPGNANARALGAYRGSSTTTATISADAAPTDATQYIWDYMVLI